MTLRAGIRRGAVVVIVAMSAILAAAGIDTVTPSSVSFDDAIAVDGSGFGATKPPRVQLVPQTSGHRTLAAKVAKGFTDTHLDVVLNHVKRDEVGAYDLVVTPAGKGAVALTKPGAVSIGYALISSFTPVAHPGGQVTIVGSLFGSKKGKLIVGNKRTKVITWTGTQIVAKLHKKTPIGVETVWVATKVGNTITTLTGMTITN